MDVNCFLVGHGTGKLFQKGKDGVINYEVGKVMHPILNEPIVSYYESNETWSSKFGDVSSGYEECRADSVGLYLATF
jgi:dipeptidyl-peptidase III